MLFSMQHSLALALALVLVLVLVLALAVERAAGKAWYLQQLRQCLHAGFIKIALPGHHLVGIADVIDRRHLAARKQFTVLMGQHQQLELRTVGAALGAQPVEAMQAVVAHPGANLFLGHTPPPRQQLYTAFTGLQAIHDLKLELRLVPLHKTP